MSNAISGVGTTFERWSGSAWVAMAEVNSISGPNKTRETIDVTSLDSTGGYREFIASIRDAGVVNLNMNYSRTTYDLLNTDFENDTLANYRIVLPDASETVLEFTGLVTEIPLEITVDDKISSNVAIKISGQISLYDNSSGAVIP
jgi:predicted secreted protein